MDTRRLLLVILITICVAVATVLILHFLGVKNAPIYGGVAAGIAGGLFARWSLRKPRE